MEDSEVFTWNTQNRERDVEDYLDNLKIYLISLM